MTSLANIPGEARCKQLVYRLLTNRTTCMRCSGQLSWRQEYGWCRTCRTKVRPKAATWFRGSNLRYRQLFVLLWCWQQRQSPGTARLVAGVSYTTVHRWYHRFRSLLPTLSSLSVLTGTIEVDESFFGRQRFGHQTVVVGAIERCSRALRLQMVTDRTRRSLEPFVRTHVAAGSTVATDAHRAYHHLAGDYQRLICNHAANDFGSTNLMENTWGVMKRHLRKLHGCIPTQNLQLYLNEWMARHNQPSWFSSPQDYLTATLFRMG